MFVVCMSNRGHTNNHYKINRKNSTNYNRALTLYNRNNNNHSNRIATNNQGKKLLCKRENCSSCYRLCCHLSAFRLINNTNEVTATWIGSQMWFPIERYRTEDTETERERKVKRKGRRRKRRRNRQKIKTDKQNSSTVLVSSAKTEREREKENSYRSLFLFINRQYFVLLTT